MRCELPEFKRCCFCIPLRYGLIVWTYVKLALGVLLMLYFAMLAVLLISFMGLSVPSVCGEVVILIIILIILFIDNILCIVFVISAHMKHYKLMKIYYIWLLIFLGIMVIMYIIIIGFVLYTEHFNISRNIVLIIIVFLNIALHLYFLLMVRSEVQKLSVNITEFRFENNAAEAECVMFTSDSYKNIEINPIANNVIVEQGKDLSIE